MALSKTNGQLCDNGLTKFHFNEEFRTDLAADLFCQRCAKFLSDTPKQERDGLDPLPVVLFSEVSFKDICFSARRGCHLCSLLELGVRIPNSQTDADTQWSLSYHINSKSAYLKFSNKALSIRPAPVVLKFENHQNSFRPDILRHQAPIHRQELSQGTLRKSILSYVKNQIGLCYQNHTTCQARETPQLPTRLIEIAANSVRLVDVAREGLSGISYMTLSHRWRTSGDMKLTKDNMSSFEAGVPLDSLPIIFRDVCQIVPALGCCFVWIDALCIIQDHEGDWLSEADRMMDVYSNSSLNIVAATRCEGLWPERIPLMCASCNLSGSTFGQVFGVDIVSIDYIEGKYVEESIRDLEINNRGWILQELELAPSLVYFTDFGPLFQCREAISCHNLSPGGALYSLNTIRDLPYRYAPYLINDALKDEDSPHQWDRLIEDYAKRSLTIEGDRLVAISGLSRLFEKKYRTILGKYCAGLWESDFELGLSWLPSYNTIRILPRSYTAPSWSWASQLSGIEWLGGRVPPLRRGYLMTFIQNLKIATSPTSSSAPNGKVMEGHFHGLMNLCRIYVERAVDHSLNKRVFHLLTATGLTCVEQCLNLDDEFIDDGFRYKANSELYLLPVYLTVFYIPCPVMGVVPDCAAPTIRRCQLLTESQRLSLSDWPEAHSKAQDKYSGTFNFCMFSLLLKPVDNLEGHYVRAGVASYSGCNDDPSIELIREACMLSELPPERYIKSVPERHAYEIKVI